MTATAWKYFTREELECHCGCGRMEIRPNFMLKLVDFREAMGFPFILSSAFRCGEHNNKVSKTGFYGPHTIGAGDLLSYGKQAYDIITYAREFGMTGIGIHQKGPHGKRFVHIDDLETSPRPNTWSY